LLACACLGASVHFLAGCWPVPGCDPSAK
jgi:hypothetical protein